MQTYETYKHSGIDWLGEIPNHWQVSRIKYLFKEINERSIDGSEDLLSVSQYTGVTRKSDKLQEGDLLTNASTLDGYKIVRIRQLVSNIMLAWNGSLAFSDFDGITSPAYCIYELTGDDNYKFFHYLFKTELYKSEFKRNSSGVIESRLRLYTEDFFNIWSILPPIHEQEAIASFLDEKCGKIDALVHIKNQQIEKLKELRQVKIHQAVTKGLDEKVELKDSGIDWIGEIPKHWEVKSIKRITEYHNQGYYTTESYVDNGIKLMRITDFRPNGKYDLTESPMVRNNNSLKSYLLEENDFVFARTGGAGNFAIISGINEKAVFASYLIRFQFNSDLIVELLYYFFNSFLFKNGIEQEIHGGVNQNIHAENIKNQIIFIPPLPEQEAIAAYLDDVTGKIDQAIAQRQDQIEKLKQYKQSLINEVVTGKVKVA